MIVIINSSPLINLAAIRRLDLLRQLYSRILIPQAVYDEMSIRGAGQPGAVEVRTLNWIEVKQVTNRALVTALQSDLDEGEAETIALGMEAGASLLLLDERRARAIATRLGLTFIGLLGVLVEAKHRGNIIAVKPLLDELITTGFWIGEQLYGRVLQTVGE